MLIRAFSEKQTKQRFNNMIRSIIFILFLSLFYFKAHSQYVPEKQLVNRIEEPLDGFKNEDLAIPLEKTKEIILLRKTNNKTRGELGRMDVWRITKYNQKLNQEWTDELLGTKNGFVYDYIIDEEKGKIYLLFLGQSAKGETQVVKKDLQFGEIDIESGKIQMYFAKIPKLNISKFRKSGNLLYATGMKLPGTLRQMCTAYLMCSIYIFNPIGALKADPYTIAVDLNSSRTFPMTTKFKGYSMNIASNSNNDGTLDVIYKNIRSKKESSVLKFKIDRERVLEVKEMKLDKDISMNSAAVIKHNNKKIIVGGFGDRSGKTNWRNFLTAQYTNGLYFGDITDEKKPEYRLYDFSDINSIREMHEEFYENMSSLAKFFSKKKTGVGEIKQQLLLHDPVVIDDEIHLRAESFTPTYTYYTTTDANGVTTTHSVFDGYLFLGFTMAAFNDEGDMLWDVSFRTGELKSFVLKETVKVMRDEYGEFTFMYSNGYEIVKRRLEGNTVTEVVDEVLSEEQEDIKRSYSQSMDFWYDDYYIAYGSQKLKEKESGLFGGKRKVFFLSKIQNNE